MANIDNQNQITKHTPGPWTIGHNYHEDVDDKNQIEIRCIVNTWDDTGLLATVFTPDSERAIANARLIAAAPELLDKCIKIVKWLNMLADAADKRCINNRLESLVEANKADAKNYRATAADIEKVITKATGGTK